VLSHLRAFARAILVPGKLSYALLIAEVSPHCFCGPSQLPPPACLGPSCLLPVGHLSPSLQWKLYVSLGLCILFLLEHWHLERREGLASPSAGVLKERMVIGSIQGACEDMAEWDTACYLGRLWKGHPCPQPMLVALL